MISKPHMRQLRMQDLANEATRFSLSSKCPLYIKYGTDSLPAAVISVEPMENDAGEIVGFVFVAQMPEAF